MGKVEKHYDRHKRLVWAKGTARDIYRRIMVGSGRKVRGMFKLPGEERLYHLLGPRHCFLTQVGAEDEAPGSLEEHLANLPPFEQWRFVLLTGGQSGKVQFELAREISGEALLEFVREPQ